MSKTKRLCGDVPKELFQDFKIEVVKRGMTMAQAVEEAAKLWIQKQHEDDIKLMTRAEEEIKQIRSGEKEE